MPSRSSPKRAANIQRSASRGRLGVVSPGTCTWSVIARGSCNVLLLPRIVRCLGSDQPTEVTVQATACTEDRMCPLPQRAPRRRRVPVQAPVASRSASLRHHQRTQVSRRLPQRQRRFYLLHRKRQTFSGRLNERLFTRPELIEKAQFLAWRCPSECDLFMLRQDPTRHLVEIIQGTDEFKIHPNASIPRKSIKSAVAGVRDVELERARPESGQGRFPLGIIPEHQGCRRRPQILAENRAEKRPRSDEPSAIAVEAELLRSNALVGGQWARRVLHRLGRLPKHCEPHVDLATWQQPLG